MKTKIFWAVVVGLYFGVIGYFSFLDAPKYADADEVLVRSNNTRHYYGLSTDTKTTHLSKKNSGSTWYEIDTGRSYVWGTNSWHLNLDAMIVRYSPSVDTITTAYDTLTAGAAYYVAGYSEVTLNIVASGIDTTGYVYLEVRPSDAGGWADTDGDSTEITNGTYNFRYAGLASTDSFRVALCGAATDTSWTGIVKLIFGRGK